MPALPAGAAPRYRPRSVSNPLKEIVEDSLEELIHSWQERFAKENGPLHPRVRDLMQAFVRCGDPHFGFLRLKCLNPDCTSKAERIVPYSCKARGACPSCSQKRAPLWAERMVNDVLPHVPYVQLVFTIPKMLRKAFLFDRSLYGDLSRAAYASTREFLKEQFPNIENPLPAMVVSPQSHGSLLNFHPHLHAVASLGVFDPQGRFHAVPEDIDFSPLEGLFRERTLKMMLEKEATSEERVQLLRSWTHSGFRVDSSRRIGAEDRAGLEGVLVYMERGPVALERLTYRRDEGLVHYRGNYHPSLGRDHQFLPPVDFLALLVPHVLLRFQCVIRCYGALSTTVRRRLGWVKKPAASAGPSQGSSSVPVLAGEESEFVRVRRRNWARLIARVWLERPDLCPSCGKEMKVLAAISSPAQDDVIAKVLRARGEWDPPWLKNRPARGPPDLSVSSQTQGERSIDPLPRDEDYFNDQDPGHDGET